MYLLKFVDLIIYLCSRIDNVVNDFVIEKCCECTCIFKDIY